MAVILPSAAPLPCFHQKIKCPPVARPPAHGAVGESMKDLRKKNSEPVLHQKMPNLPFKPVINILSLSFYIVRV